MSEVSLKGPKGWGIRSKDGIGGERMELNSIKKGIWSKGTVPSQAKCKRE